MSVIVLMSLVAARSLLGWWANFVDLPVGNSSASSLDPVAPILLALILITVGAALGGRLMQRLGQAAVLGELLVGVIFGNVGYFVRQPTITILREGGSISMVVHEALVKNVSLGEAAREVLPHNTHDEEIAGILSTSQGVGAISVYSFVDEVSRIALVILLFLVGLETSVEEMRRVGFTALLVSVLGVLFSLLFGFGLAALLLPQENFSQHIFIGGILTATSIGITARVLRDLKQLERMESKIILGAAVIDDILGLLILAVVGALAAGTAIHFGSMAWMTAKAALFIVGSIVVGLWLTPILVKRMTALESEDEKVLFGVMFAFFLAWLASLAGLSTIIGAFAAGLILGNFFDQHFDGFSLRGTLSPFESLIVPVFFVLIGLQVKLEVFSPSVLLFAALITAGAILGKVLAGFGASPKLNRLAIGFGMMPRGEVGLIFAGVGRSLGIVSDQVFASVVIMVIVTTLLTPALLKARLRLPQRPIEHDRFGVSVR